MPIAGVSIEWEDQSQIASLEAAAPEPDKLDRPIYMTVITSDKGPEEWQHKVFGADFFKLYGVPSFKRHGQPSVQAAQIIESGGYLTVKRVCAENSKLANIALFAEVTKITDLQEVDENNVPIWKYTDPNSSTNEPIYVASMIEPVPGLDGIPAGVQIQKNIIDGVRIRYFFEAFSADGPKIKTFEDIVRKTYQKPSVGLKGTYPLAVFTDVGRGESNKMIRIYADTTVSSPVSYFRYFLEVRENGEILETIPFTLNPDIIENNYSMSLQTQVFRNSKQIRARFFDDIYNDFIENVEFFSNQKELRFKDVLFGRDYNQKYIRNFDSNAASILDTPYGVPLLGGENGEFKDAPAAIPHIEGGNVVDIAFRNAFSGDTEDGDDVYDLDNNRIDVIFDANYHQEVKRAIEFLVDFREDAMYFRDYTTDCNSITDMKVINQYVTKSRFCASYANHYYIYDPYTRKEINVTVTYDLAKLFINHFLNGRNRPFCGQRYGITIPQADFIPGTLNFSPKRTPSDDQRKVFDDLRINYLTYYDGNVLTMNTEYTSQTSYTQLSWINNVLSIQEIIKAIRVVCPKLRYSFLDGDDLVKYKQDVQSFVIDNYANRFLSCSIEYASNAVYDSNKIIYAIIKVRFRNFVQTEKFKIIALPS